MARCHICDRKLEVVDIDERDGTIKPCDICQTEIDDTVFEQEDDIDVDLETWLGDSERNEWDPHEY